ncbi:EpsG family protein [Gammaproteobacteria bacterium]|nr:EpsG family protein [Gammaproteobacteria bacterium]
MLTYFGTYITLLSSAWAGRNAKTIRIILYWIILIGLSVFVGFRVDVGCDYGTYQNHYAYGSERAFAKALSGLDPGHWLLISLLNYLGFHSQSLNIVASALFFIGLHFLAKRQPDPLAFIVLCFPILIINMPMAATRQSIAIGFMCLAYAALIDRRRVLFVVWIFFGVLFHSSILIFLLLVPFITRNFNFRNIFIGLIFIIPLIAILLQTQAAELANSRYIQGGSEAAGAAFRLGILTLSGAYFLLRLAPTWRKQFPHDYKLVLMGSWMMVSFFVLFFVSSVIGDRFGYYLIPIQAMIFSRIPYLKLGRLRQIHAFAPYVGLTLVFIVWTMTSWHFSQCYIPYKFGFD